MDFPWEMMEFARLHLKRRTAEGAKKEEIRKELQEIQLPAVVITEILESK